MTTSNSGKDEKRAAPAEHRPCRNPETLDRTIKAELVSLFRELESQNRELLLAKADLEISEKKYRDLFESAPIGYFTLDAEGTILEANRAGAAILGKTPAIVTNARFQRFLDPDESKVFSGMVARACSGGKRENCEVRLNFPANPQKRAGTQRWALIEAQATGTVTGRGESIRLAVIDITPRIRAETALRESEKRYRTFIDNFSGIAFAGNLHMRPEFLQGRVEDITGYPADMFTRGVVQWASLVNENDRGVIHATDERLRTDPGEVQRREYRIRTSDGHERWVEEIVQRVASAHEEGILQGTVQDISARKAAETEVMQYRTHLESLVAERTETLQEANERLQKEIRERERREQELQAVAQRLRLSNEDLERFAYVSSHDLQEPVRMVISYAQLLMRRYRGKFDADADEFLGYIVEGGQRMQMLITDLLEFSRVSNRGQVFGPVDTNEAISGVLEELVPEIRQSGAAITWGTLPVVMGDGVQIRQVFHNLVINALKFRRDEAPRIHIAAEPAAGMWRFSVADNGIGIEPQYWDRIFIIFQRLHSRAKYGGTGIGLAIVKRVIQRHGGKIWVDSEPGRGTTFLFTLPAVDEATDQSPV